jgi:hypothetical protein
MIRRTTWILLGVLVAAVLVYTGWQRFAPAEADVTPTAVTESLWSLLPEQVDSVRLTDLADPRVVVVVRDVEQGWRMQAPAVGSADAGRIEAALAGVLAPPIQQSLDAPADLEPFGLAPAHYRVTLLMGDGTARSVDVGAVDPTGAVYYVVLPGEKRVLMVSRFSLEDLLGLLASPPYSLPTETPTVGTVATEAP